MRAALLSLTRYIVTCRTAKHRLFGFIAANFIADAKIVAVASDSASILGTLNSRIHKIWAERTGAWLGVGNDSNYNHSECFAKFPFPSPSDLLNAQIATVAEELDAFRKQRQKEHPALTLTQMYNVLEKLKAIEAAQQTPASPPGLSRGSTSSGDSTKQDVDGRDKPGHDEERPVLTEDEGRIKDEGLILILKELHEKLDRLVFAAYGWPQTLSDEEILERLVALNHERAAEERRGHVRWLRPDYQIPRFGKDVDKMAAKEEGAQIAADLGLPAPGARKPSFPSDAVAQTAAVFASLAAVRGPADVAGIAANYRKTKNLDNTISDVLGSLTRLGHVTTRDGKTFEIRRSA